MKKYISLLTVLLIGIILVACQSVSLTNQEYEIMNGRYPGSDFRAIDEYVLNLDKEDEESFESIASAIAAVAETDWEKARGVWTWVTHNIAYDVKGYFNGNSITDAETGFEERRAVCSGYSHIFIVLANLLDLDVTEVRGYAKGYGFIAGSSPAGTNHSWIMIRIDDECHLFDPTWGAGGLLGRTFRWSYKEYYFDSDPELYIFNHFPDNPEYQFIDPAINREVYFRLPSLSDAALGYGFDLDGILDKTIAGQTFTAPGFYDCDVAPSYMNIPLQDTLAAGESYHFVIEAKTDRLVIINGVGNPIYIQGNNGMFDFNHEARKGELVIGLITEFTPGKKSWSYLVKYEVAVPE